MRKQERGIQGYSKEKSPETRRSRNGGNGGATVLRKGSSPTTEAFRTSHENRFQPAFLDTRTNTVHISCYSDGRPAPVHLPGNLPKNVQRATATNQALPPTAESVVVGFLHNRRFYTREQAKDHHNNDGIPQRIEKRLLFW